MIYAALSMVVLNAIDLIGTLQGKMLQIVPTVIELSTITAIIASVAGPGSSSTGSPLIAVPQAVPVDAGA
ncbi:hypothetical protein [Teichococcus aestuarii]|uniref:hypothetical protein n=1 Tax=Teichococcus aestuarii TaxID=568898 RepID=UPI0011B1E988|nr:hypothetical protein [Pseudoroseomonas aestuarii]